MEIQLTGKNIGISPELKKRVERKLGKLSRHLAHIRSYKVEVAEEKTKSPSQHFVVQVTLDSNGTLLRGEERGEDLFEAIDKVAQTMDRQIERYKGRLNRRRGSGAKALREEESEPRGEIVKVKRFPIKPMPLDEAIDQMELLGHDFFLFFNAESDSINLLYRRRDGGYGLIEPILD